MKKLVCTAVIMCCINNGFAGDPIVQKVPENMVEKGYVLEVTYVAERDEYMSPNTSITKIMGFRDRKTCWDHAAAISKAIREAAKDAKTKGRENFSCNEAWDFKRSNK